MIKKLKIEFKYNPDITSKDYLIKVFDRMKLRQNIIDDWTMEEVRTKFARKCDVCGKVFNKGYCIGSGESYYCSKECMNKEIPDKEFDELYDNGNGDSYWTEWEDEDDFQYWEDGTEIEENEFRR